MNCNNANKELGFDKFSECDYNLHWSFSNFNRMLMAAGRIAQLPENASVLELGAGSSELQNIVAKNFRRDDIEFIKIDGDEQYKDADGITVLDITTARCEIFVKALAPFDAVVCMETIEHIDRSCVNYVLSYVYKALKPKGLFLLSTPTPAYDGRYEDRVWPEDHDEEFSNEDICQIVNRYFKIEKQVGWSLEEREYLELLEDNVTMMWVYGKLKGAFPESFIKAMIACLAPVKANRQLLLACTKRRVVNGGCKQT